MRTRDFNIFLHCGKCKLPLVNRIHLDESGKLSKFGIDCPLIETPFEEEI